jgi:hypothetical protein
MCLFAVWSRELPLYVISMLSLRHFLLPYVIPVKTGIQKEYLQTNKDNIKRIDIL